MPYRYLLTCPSIIAACCAGFASYWGLALGLTWFTSYLVGGLGSARRSAATSASCPGCSALVVVLSGGYISQRLKSNGVSSRLCRGVLACADGDAGRLHPALRRAVPTPDAKIALLVFGAAIGSTIYVVLPMIVSELTPQPQRAAMLAITTSIVTLAGVLRRSSWAR